MSPGYLGQILQDNDAYVIRQLGERIAGLEKVVAAIAPTGVVVQWPGDLRGNFWSANRKEAVGTKWTRWYKLDDLNQTLTFEETDRNPANRPVLVGSPAPVQGQPGGMVSEGSYSIRTHQTSYLRFPSAPIGQRSWTLEAMFNPSILPAADKIIVAAGGTGTGPQLRISNATGGPGSFLTIYLDGPASRISTGITLKAGNWYHAIVVSEAALEINWYVGEFDPVTRKFTYVSGTTDMTMPPAASTGNGQFGGFDGYLGDVLIYGGEIDWIEAANRVFVSFQTAAPEGWLTADGAAVSRNKYSRLFSRIGITNGAGDGSKTFNLPNQAGAIVKT